jgi:hypothetical protein
MPTAKEQKVSTPLVTLNRPECYRLLGGAPVASIELQRHPLPGPLLAGYTLDGPDILLVLDEHRSAAVLGSTVTVSVAVSDPRTAATWRVVAFGTAEASSRGIRVRPTSVLGFCVSVGSADPDMCA